MKQEEEFKNNLYDLIHSKEFPFDEANWEEAQKLMGDMKITPKFSNKYFVLAIGALLFVTGVSYYFIFQKRFNQTNSLIQLSKEDNISMKVYVTNGKMAHLSNSNNDNSADMMSKKNSNNNLPLITARVNLDNKEMRETKVSDIDQVGTKNKSKHKLFFKLASSDKTLSNFNSEKVVLIKSSINNAYKNERSDDLHNINTQDGIVENKLSNSEYERQQYGKSIKDTKVIELQSPAFVSNIENKEGNQSNENFESKNRKTNDISESKMGVYTHFGGQNEKALPEINSDLTEAPIQKLDDSNVMVANVLPINPANEVINDVAFSLPLALDSSQKEAFKSDSPEKIKTSLSVDSVSNTNKLVVSPEVKHMFSFELGTAYLFGWRDNQGIDAKGFNPLGGINYAFNFKPKFSFLTGLLYTSIGNIRNTNYTAKRVKYSFGEEIDYTTISTKNMYYLTVPIKFLYRLKTKNFVGFGLNASYLLDVSSDVSTYNKRFNTLSPAVITKSNGYKGGFNNYDLQFGLFYRRRLLEKLSIHSEFNVGLLDIKKDKYFKPAQFERNIGFRLTLVYDIFNK
jgi:hypothetical protein